VVRGATGKVSPILRKAADMSGGFIASCRNPVRASYVRKNAALGGISRALALGHAIMAAEGSGGDAVIAAICKATSGEILGRGRVTRKAVTYTDAAFDIGTIAIDCGGRSLVLHVMNEYMAIEDGSGHRLATFPDVITTLGLDGRPVSVGHITEGAELSVFHIAKAHLPLSSSVKDAAVYPVCEAALGIPIARYALA
jgi:uncharacterized protein